MCDDYDEDEDEDKNYWELSEEEKDQRRNAGWSDDDLDEYEGEMKQIEEEGRAIQGDEEYERIMDNPE